jgi:prepilin-type processing-associated H-X9-DG protein
VVVLSVLAQTAHHAHPSHVGCLSNLKNISVAISDYATENNGDLPHLTPSVRDVPRSWRVELLPFLRYADVYSRYRFDRAWDSPENLTHAQTFLRAYRCPANPHRFTPDLAGRFHSDFLAIRGPETAFPDGKGLSLRTIAESDGLDTTLIIVESCGQRVVWTEPRDVDLSQQVVGANLRGDKPGHSRGVLSSYHTGAINVVLADGSVRGLSANIDPKLLRSILTATGGEPIRGSSRCD